MAKVLSAVMPVHNESRLLPLCLKRLAGLIDELVVIEGGDYGASADTSHELIVSAFPETKFVQVSNGVPWDRANIAAYLPHVSGDMVMSLSADMLIDNSEALRSAIDSVDVDMYLCKLYDLWVDASHVKKNSDNGEAGRYIPLVSRPSVLSRKRSVDDLKPEERVYLTDVSVFHVGWLRPFASQVEKHIRHVRAGAWKETGAQLLSLGDKAVESWAVHHVMRYKNDPGLKIHLPGDIAGDVNGVSYMQGFEEYVADYERRHGEEFYAGLMYSVPTELIV